MRVVRENFLPSNWSSLVSHEYPLPPPTPIDVHFHFISSTVITVIPLPHFIPSYARTQESKGEEKNLIKCR